MKWWDPHTNKLKYFPFENFDEHNNKLGKGWSPGSEIINGTAFYILSTFKTDISDHPFVKYDICEVTVTFPRIGNPVGIISQ